jgi:multidrug efflux pump subunit AcrB
VVAPLEQEINGVENMTYMISNSTGDGRFQIDVTFDLGANLDIAQVQVQNRVANRSAPHTCGRAHDRRATTKSSPDLMMAVHLYSSDRSRDTLFISNCAKVEVTDVLSRFHRRNAA